MLPAGQDWANDHTASSEYISNETIFFQTDRWKASKTFYWPKQGSLTFFAWTINTDTPGLTDASVGCTNTSGITVDSYDITSNQNVDFLVADVVADEKANTSNAGGTWEKGVPTVFKHALSKLEFIVKTVKNSADYNYDADNVTFNVKSIKLKGVNNEMAYAQGITEGSSAHTWTDASPAVELSEISVFSNTPTKATSAGVTLSPAPADYYIVIPQAFDTDDILEIKYDIVTKFTGTPVTEEVTQEVKLSDVYTAGWAATKKYVLTISLGINEILWDPDVVDWTAGTTAPVTF